MAAINGVRVYGTLVPSDTTDTYPVTDPQYGIDGLRSVLDVTARDAIPDPRRRQGMMVVVQTDSGSGPNLMYQLNAPPWNYDDTDWTLFTGTGGITSIDLTGDVQASGTGTVTATVVSYNDGILFGDMASQNSFAVAITGGTITGLPTPVIGSDAVNKDYVDNLVAGFQAKAACDAVQTGPFTSTYNNGAAGVGATLTNAGPNVVLTIDGYSPPVGDRVLVAGQANPAENGIYDVTNAGTVSTPWVLTRSSDFNTPTQITPGAYAIITEGATLQGTMWVQTETGPFTIGTTPIKFVQWQAGTTQISLAGDVVGTGTDVITSTVVALKGAPLGDTTPTDGYLLVADGTDWVSVALHGDATIDGTGLLTLEDDAVLTNNILDGNVTYAKIQDVAPSSLLGNPTAALGDVVEIAIDPNTLVFSGSVLTVLPQKVTVAENGTIVGSRGQVNFIDGQNSTVTVVDNALNDSVDVTVEVDVATTLSTGVVQVGSGLVVDPTGLLSVDPTTLPTPTFTNFSISGMPAVMEVGAAIAAGPMTFTWTTDNDPDVAVDSITIEDTTAGADLGTGLPNTGTASLSINGVINSAPDSYTWTIFGESLLGASFEDTFVVNWYWAIYYGSSPNVTLTSAQIVGLQSSELQESATGIFPVPALDYKYFCIPLSYNSITVIRDANTGLNVPMADLSDDPAYSFTNSNGTNYAMISVTNVNGVSTNYAVYRSKYTLGAAVNLLLGGAAPVAPPGAGPPVTAGGIDTSVQFNASGGLVGNSVFTYVSSTGVLSSPQFSGDGSLLTALNASSLATGLVAPPLMGTGTTDLTTFLRGDGTWQPIAAVGGTPAGADTQVQFNSAGAFGADPNFTYDETSETLNVVNLTATNIYVTNPIAPLAKGKGKAKAKVAPSGYFVIDPGTLVGGENVLGVYATYDGATNLVGPLIHASVTNTSSAPNSLVLELTVDSVDVFTVDVDGHVSSAGAVVANQFIGDGSLLTDLDLDKITHGVLDPSRLPTTGLEIAQHTSPVITVPYGPTVTLDLSLSNWFEVTLQGPCDFVLINAPLFQQFFIIIRQDGAGNRVPNWFTGVIWPDGIPPELSADPDSLDLYGFKSIAPGVFLGMNMGQNFC